MARFVNILLLGVLLVWSVAVAALTGYGLGVASVFGGLSRAAVNVLFGVLSVAYLAMAWRIAWEYAHIDARINGKLFICFLGAAMSGSLLLLLATQRRLDMGRGIEVASQGAMELLGALMALTLLGLAIAALYAAAPKHDGHEPS